MWPASEPWPVCGEEHYVEKRTVLSAEESAARRADSLASAEAQLRRREQDGAPPQTLEFLRADIKRLGSATGPIVERTHLLERPPAPIPLVPVLQLHRGDAPGLEFPEGTDLLQLLWCPHPHTDMCHEEQAFWRNAASVTDVRPTAPAPDPAAAARRVPRPCTVEPEQVTEYPPICLLDRDADHFEPFGLLPAETEDRLYRWDREQPEDDDYFQLATAPGWKVGGWDPSAAEPDHLRTCSCGTLMRPLLSTYRWENLAGWPSQNGPDSRDDEGPTGVDFARNGSYAILYCPVDPRTHGLEHIID
ncbi:hypothetical protein [Kitasatospora phosalacinea]|uniref:hypothetical protein n=1 Tax=Kitasatospora phosalacinea TaxID=2065 RepID=UPI0025570DB6|nr:hypothetical protein [Kitasatospora phosalacinea]